MKKRISPAFLMIMMIAIGLTVIPLRGASQTFLDLIVEKSVDNYEPAVGSQIVFTITVTNLSHVYNATGVEVEDVLDAGFQYVSSSATKGSYNSSTSMWTVGTVAADQTETLDIVVKVLTLDRVCNAATMTAVDQTDTNGKNDKFTICLNPRVADELDLAVAKDVYNAVPQVGGSSVFTVTVTNLSATISATNVEIEDVLDANLVYQYSSESAGSYNSSTGIWSIPIILPSQTVTMDMTVTANGSADNIASLKSLDQTDTNSNNNEDMVSVTVSGSSGGNSGGLESNGSLASKIAVRNFKRSKTDQKNIFSQPSEMLMFTEQLAQNRVITAESNLKAGTNLAELFPEEGPFGSKAYVSTPEDLLGITNAEEVFAVDYYDSGEKRLGAILALTTLNGEVYSHTKMVCDRMSGGSLDLVRTEQIDGKNFIMSKLVQASGDVDYAISFIAWEEDGVMKIDNRWNIADYQPADNASVHNFQVWSVTAQSTVELAEKLISRLAEDNKLSFVNADNQAPATYAANGYYENGNIMINLKTNGQADNLHIKGNLTRNEGAITEPFSYDINIPAESEGLVNIEIPVGNIFDAGFSLQSDLLEISDQLYFADGPWGNSFEDDGAWINHFATEPYDGKQFADSYLLERNAEMSGQVRTYASLFRAMKAGSQAVDMTGYNILEFDASGSGLVELIVAKASIEHWSDQSRTSFNLTSNEQTIRIDLSQLKASSANASFSANDVLSVAFNLIGDGQNWQDFSIRIKNLRFAKGSSDQILTDQDMIQMKAYPNPVSDMATIEFSIPETNNVHIALYDITGKEVQVLADQEFSFGTHRLQLSAADLSNGMYFMKLRYNHQVESQRISVLK